MNALKQAKSGAPAWMVTFADMMALLLTFFILLLSVSTTDVNRYRAVAESMSEAFGGGNTIIVKEGAGEDIVGEPTDAASLHKTHLNDPIKTFVKKVLAKEIDNGVLEVEWTQGNLVIRFPDHIAFDSGSDRLHQRFYPLSKKIAKVLARTEGKIIVAGHTDDQPINNFRFRSNWDLSSARAVSVIHALMNGGESLASGRFVAQGLAETQPRFKNDSEKNRAANRRVELTVKLQKTSS